MITRILLKPIATLLIVMAVGSAMAQPPVGATLQREVMKLLQSNQSAEALQLCIKRVGDDKDDAEARQALETAFEYCVMKQQLPVLETSFRNWVAREDKNPLAHCWLGGALTTLVDRRGEAEQELLQALKLDPKCAEVRFRLAGLRELQGKAEDAQAGWRKFLELEPDTDRAWLVRRGVAVIGTKNVTHTPGVPEIEPAWSPDGKHLVFLQGWNWDLYRLNLATGERKTLTQDEKYETRLDWSPDGRRILVTKIANPKHICALPADGSQPPQRLGQESATTALAASWSVDGTEVFFSKPDGLWTMSVDGQGEHPLPKREMLRTYHTWPSPAPDGRHLVCAAPLAKGRRDVCLFPREDPAAHAHLTTSHAEHYLPSVSPDGRHVVFSANWKGWYDAGICAVKEPFREVSLLPSFFEAEWGFSARWSPDGHALALTRPRFGDLWIVHLGGLDVRPVTLTTKPQGYGLLVTLTNRSAEPQQFDLTYRLFDANSVLMAEGAVGKPDFELQPKEVIEFPLPLPVAKQPGTYTVKLTAMTEKGERMVELVDYEVK